MLPPTPQPTPPRQIPDWAKTMLGGLLVLISFGCWVLASTWWNPPPIDDASTSRPTSAPVSSGPAFDPTASAALVQIAEAFSTSVAPTVTPLPPTPTYTLPTAIPATLCGTWVPIGSVCEQPLAPKPSPTPIPDCPVAPRDLCVWRGVLGTPLPGINAGSPWHP